MLKGIDPLLNAELLFALRAMGHGDVLVVADANFPADTVARKTVFGRVIRIDADAPAVIGAVGELMPLDRFEEGAFARMQVRDDPDDIPEVQEEAIAAMEAAEGRPIDSLAVERFEFYELAKNAFAVVQTAERRFFGCFALTKGVIAPDA